jgi:outer membrane protein OmpA-like peptidoglycan-associated protein
MDEAEAVMANLQTALQEAQAQSEAAVAERDKLRTNLGSVRETLAAERAESGALAERHAALEAEADQLREQATGLAARVTDLEAAAGRSVAEINGMADELVGQLQHGRELAEVVATVRAERAALRGALMRERDRIEPLEAEQTANGTGALQARLTEVERERGRLREELAAVKQIAGSKLDAVVKAEARVADLTAELERTRAELQRVRNVPITQDERSVEAKLPAPGEPQFAALEAEGLRFDRSAEGWLVAIADGVEFAPDSAILAPSADRTLAKVAELIDAYPGRPVLIRGHTDGLGEAAYNRALSADRAEAVRDYLAGRFRIDAERIEVEGLGESRPLASNATAEGRRANRRVEIVIRE